MMSGGLGPVSAMDDGIEDFSDEDNDDMTLDSELGSGSGSVSSVSLKIRR